MIHNKYHVTWKRSLGILMMFSMVFTSAGMYEMNASDVNAAITDDELTDSEKFDEYTQELFQSTISSDILTNNFNVIDSSKYGVERSDIPVVLSGYDEESLQASVQQCKDIKQFLKSISYNSLTSEQQDLYDLLDFEVGDPADVEKYMYYSKAFGAYSGIQTNLITTLTAYNFDERQDYVDYLQLLETVPQFMEDAVKYEQKRSELGLFMSDRELDDVIDSIQALVQDGENSVLIATFDNVVDKSDLNNRDKIRFKKQNRETVLNTVLTAYQTAAEGLNELRGTGIGDEDGLTALPDGKDYYEYLLKYYSGTERSPLEYIQIFDELSEQCLNEIYTMADTFTLANFYGPSTKYTASTPEDYLELLMENTSEYFTSLDDISFNINYVDEALGTYVAPAYVMTPQVDATNEFTVNINPAYESSASYDTVAHEAYPGHLYQFVTLNQSEKNPLFNIYTNYGYVEGWANHVQSMAYYFTDASPLYARYMQLAMNYTNYQVYKADILINYCGYTKKQIETYMTDLGYDTATADYMYEHFITVPAYNMCYVAGQSELELLVNQAQETLGDDFSYLDFHDFFLDYACCTYETINKHFTEWLALQ